MLVKVFFPERVPEGANGASHIPFVREEREYDHAPEERSRFFFPRSSEASLMTKLFRRRSI